MKRDRGAALILVLMVTGVLGLLILQFGLTARDQVGQSQRLLDRARAELAWHTTEAELKFDLLTQPWVVGMTGTDGAGIAESWRFDDRSFVVANAVVRLQDVAGLIALPQRAGSMSEFENLLMEIGVSEDRRSMVSGALQWRLEMPDGLPLQSVLELRDMGLTSEEIEHLRAFSTSYPNLSFNPSTAPAEVLRARFSSPSVQRALLQLRERGDLDSGSYAAVLDSPADDFTVFFPGPAFRWQISSRVGDAGVGRERTWVIKPYDVQPLLLWESRDMPLANPT